MPEAQRVPFRIPYRIIPRRETRHGITCVEYWIIEFVGTRYEHEIGPYCSEEAAREEQLIKLAYLNAVGEEL